MKELRFISKNSLSMQAFNNYFLETPYFMVVKAAGWLLLLSNGTTSSSANLLPT
jgi:hypothetical protein